MGSGSARTAIRRASDRPGAKSLLARDRELARLRRLIARTAGGSGAALVVRGDAGSGKSALLSAALEEADGVTVLPVDGLRFEAEVPYSGLERLLCATRAPAFGVGTETRFSEETASRMSYVAVARGLRDVLVDLVEQAGPLVLRADDAQWLDVETRRLLASLAGRIVDLPIALLMAIRSDAVAPAVSALDQMAVTGLGPGHIAELVTRLSGNSPSEAVAARLTDSLQGNPQAITDVVPRLSSAQLAGSEPLPEPLIIGDRLIDAFSGCLSGLEERCRRALVLSASVPPTAGLRCLRSVLGSHGIMLSDLCPAEDAGLVRLTAAGVEFTHPLTRAAVFSAAPPDERRVALGLVAECVVETETAAGERPGTPVPDPLRIDLMTEPAEPVRRAAGADQPAAPVAATPSEAYSLQLLGGFAVQLGDDDVTPKQAQPAQAVKLIALRGKLTVDELIEALWPEAEPGVGRVRIRNVLSRVRDACPGLIDRYGETLYLSSTVTVDMRDFEHEADNVLGAQMDDGASRAEDATLALALYTGELLPGDRYATWASAERERLAGRHRELLEVVMDESESAGDILHAVRLAEEAIVLQPYDESLYARAAGLMARLGWRYKALQMLRKAEAVAAELGVAPSAMVRQLQADLRTH